MRTPSWDAMGLDRGRAGAVVLAAFATALLAVLLLARPFLGGLAFVLAPIVGLATAYTLAAAPKRSLEQSALLQAREAPTLAASAAVYLQSTRSRSKTILMLRSGEPALSASLAEMRRRTLLGMDLGEATLSRAPPGSESVRRIVRSVLRTNGANLADQGEELQSILTSSQSSEETKFPVFMTISFFLPIMLMLFAAIARHTDPVAMVSLALLEVVVLDLALSFSATERRKLSA